MKKIVNLFNLPENISSKIVNVKWEKNLSRRLMELGFVKGQEVTILYRSPKKNLFMISILNYVLTIRHNAVKLIEVEYEK